MGLPSAKRVRDLLETQLRREVHLRPDAPVPPAAPGVSLGVYVDAHLATAAVVVVDLAGAARLGAAAGLVPVGVAATAVADRALPPLLSTHFEALLRDWAGLFDPGGRSGVRLYDAVLAGAPAPRDAVAVAAAVGHRLDLTASVRGYGDAHLSLVQGR